MEHPEVTVIVLNHNGREYLGRCLASLERQSYPQDAYEILLVDNASSDGSVEFVKENFPGVRILRLEKNYGVPEGRNRGIEIARGEYIAFLDNDAVADEKWLEELVKAVEKDKNIAMCGSKMLVYEDKGIINHAGGKFTIIGAGMDVGMGMKDGDNFNIPGDTGYACGGSCLMKKDDYLEAGRLDPDYFNYHEDVDLCWRLWILGRRVIYVPTSVAYHKFGGTLGGRKSYQRMFLCQKNRLANVVKNFEPINMIKGLFLNMAYSGYIILSYLYERDIRGIENILQAYLSFAKELPNLLKKRRLVQEKRKVPDKELVKKGLLLSLREAYEEERRIAKEKRFN